MMHDPSKSSERALVEAIRAIYSSHRERLRELKQEAIRTGAGPESLWEGLVRSAGTWGNASAGLKLMRTPGFHKQLGWRALAALGDRAREARMLAALKRAGCRWPNRKARFLANRLGAPEGNGRTRSGEAQARLGTRARWKDQVSAPVSGRRPEVRQKYDDGRLSPRFSRLDCH